MSPQVLRLLRDGNFNSDTCIDITPLPHCQVQTTIAFLPPPFDICLWDFEFAVFPFPRVFRLTRKGPTLATPPLIIAKDGNFDDILVITCNCIWYPHCPYFCVAYPSRLAIEYCWQQDLCTLLIILPIAYIHHCCISWYHLLCHKVVIAYTIAILVRQALHEKRAQTSKSQTSI